MGAGVWALLGYLARVAEWRSAIISNPRELYIYSYAESSSCDLIFLRSSVALLADQGTSKEQSGG
jgi:hypothetical protein